MTNTIDPRSLSLDELRSLRNKLQAEDDVVSYVRRVAQARVDLVRAEQHRRERGERSEDLSSELRVVLSSHLTSGAPRPPRPVEDLGDNELSNELDRICAENGFSRLDDLTPDELNALERELTAYERRVSDDRRERFDRLDALSAELVRRYRDGEASAGGDQDDPFGVGAFIRRQREQAEMSVRRLAELADVSNPYLSQVERGLRKPSAEILQQVAHALKISVETLYVKAGILPDDEYRTSSVREAIDADEYLTDDQKRALLNVYESFLVLMRRVAVISLHTSPLLQPGSGDSGGMNVYVRELVSSLAQAGVECYTYTRADREGLPCEVTVEPNHRVVHIEAGPHHLPKEALGDVVDEFTDRVLEHLDIIGGVDVVHANYWLSGVAAHRIKHELDIPFVSTFHTLARVKAEGGDPEPAWRDRAEAELINCADAICVSCPEEEAQFRRLYGDPQGQIEIIAPGVEHALFGPGDRAGARRAIDVDPAVPMLLFVGRIQPLKGPDVAIRALHALGRPDARLVIVGGASGTTGDGEVERAHELVDELGLHDQVDFVEPQPHHILSTYY
ncbi:mshA, partial [Symbiodinium sp. KB8]